MAAKNTHTLIPFCHALLIESCKLHIRPVPPNLIYIDCTVRVSGKTVRAAFSRCSCVRVQTSRRPLPPSAVALVLSDKTRATSLCLHQLSLLF